MPWDCAMARDEGGHVTLDMLQTHTLVDKVGVPVCSARGIAQDMRWPVPGQIEDTGGDV